MMEDLQQSPVLDLDALLAPISEDEPSGENTRYAGLYDEIAEAKRADDTLLQGEWQTQAKVADHRKVIQLTVDALMTRTKDIQIASWMSDSLVAEHGFVGLRDALRLVSGLQENFWDTLHPEIDEGDMEGRANAIGWMDTQLAMSVKRVPIINGYGFLAWEDAQRFDIPEDTEHLDSETLARVEEMKEQVKREGRTTRAEWKKARTSTRRLFVEQVNYALEESIQALRDLDRVNEEKYDRNQVPSINNLMKSLDQVHTQLKKILEEKRAEEPTDEELAGGDIEVGANGAAGTGGSGSGPGGSVSGRADALRRLSEIAAFFQKTEPHSPVAYLVQRAVKWGNMPLTSWLEDVIKDEAVLGHLRETLGMDGSGYSADYGSSDYASDSSAEYSSDSASSSDDW